MVLSALRAMSSMWPAYTGSSFGKLHLGFREDPVAKSVVQVLRVNDVHPPPAEKTRKLIPDRLEANQAGPAVRVEPNQDIDIAVRPEIFMED